MSKFEITPAHEAINNAIEAGERHLMISAVAGSGKTTTILEALKLIPTERVMFLAFNKSIATELAMRVPQNVQACTLNSLGHRAFGTWLSGRGLSRPKLSAWKSADIADSLLSEDDFAMYSGALKKLTGLAKGQGLIPSGRDTKNKAPFDGLMADTVENWMRLINRFGVELPDDETRDPALTTIQFAREILDAGLRTNKVIDFDDQLYMTLAFDVPMSKFDRVFVDEAQDLNPVQLELVARSLGKDGKVCAVGDPCQAIYGFRGADADSMPNIKARFDCLELPLHVSYRCPKAIVAEAQKVVSHIQPHKDAQDGSLFGAGAGKDDSPQPHDEFPFIGGDMVLCRFNAPLVRVCYSNIRRGIPTFIMGREVGAGLIALVKKLGATSIKNLAEKLDAWEDNEVAKLERAGKKEDRIAGTRDRAECLRVFVEMADTIPGMIRKIEEMFRDKDPGRMVRLCTIHKSKGLEAERVFVLNRDEMPCKWASQTWQLEQEMNLIYVAVTRSQRHLQYITAK